MLKDMNSSAIVPVSDIARARRFRSDVPGLELGEEGMCGVMVFRTGATQFVVYRPDAAGTNRANAVIWDVEGEIGEFRGDIHHADGMKLVWFRDPDGNILHVNQMPDAS